MDHQFQWIQISHQGRLIAKYLRSQLKVGRFSQVENVNPELLDGIQDVVGFGIVVKNDRVGRGNAWTTFLVRPQTLL